MRAAVILSGCGFLDGSEIHESVLLLLSLAEKNITYQCFSLNKPIPKVTSHLTRSPLKDSSRNMLDESARIARGDIKDLSQLNPSEFDLLCLPGGFGAAANLCDFATKGENCHVDPEVSKTIRAFHDQKKPIVAICIAPILIAKALQDFEIELTLGPNTKDYDILKKMGMKPKKCNADEICIDKAHKIYSAPGYMAPPNLSAIYHSFQKIMSSII